MVAAGGSEFAPRSKPQPEGTLVKARAWRWQRMLDDGLYAVSEIGDAENISKSYVSQCAGYFARDGLE